MYGRFKDHLDRRAPADPGPRPLQEGARPRDAPGRRDPDRGRAQGPQLLRQQLPRACATSRGSWPPPTTPSSAGASAWPRSASSAAPSRSTRSSSGGMADFLGMDDAILYSSAFDANGGVFEPLLDEKCAIISDELNHASIIDGVRLWPRPSASSTSNNDMADLEDQLDEAARGQVQAHRHGRRLLHGRHHRPGRQDLRPGREVRRPGHGRRLPRHGLHRADRPRHARALRRAWTASTSSSRPSARPSAAPPAAASPAAGRSSSSCASARAPTSSPTRSPRPSPAPRSRSSRSSTESTELRDRLMANTAALPRGHGGGRLPDRPRHPSDRPGPLRPPARRRPAQPGLRRRPARGGDLRHRLLAIPVVPGGQVPHPGPDQRRPHDRADRLRPRQVPQGRPEARRHPGVRLIPAPVTAIIVG